MMQMQVELTPVECATCGTPFAMSSLMVGQLKQTGRTFYCPNGHTLSFGSGENEELKQRIKDQATTLRFKNEAIERLEKGTSSQKGQITKLKKKLEVE